MDGNGQARQGDAGTGNGLQVCAGCGRPAGYRQGAPAGGGWPRMWVVLGIAGGLVLLLLLAGAAISLGSPRASAQPAAAAAPDIAPNDVFVRRPVPAGDNETALIPVEIEMMNIGKGRSGNMLVWCGAFNHSQPNLLLDDFSTSDLRKMSDYSLTASLAPAGKPGSIVRLDGELRLPRGDYDLRLRVYEDGGNRTLVSGLIRVIVDRDSVRVPDPYTPEGSSGRSVPARAQDGAPARSVPGFGALWVLAAACLSIAVIAGRRAGRTG